MTSCFKTASDFIIAAALLLSFSAIAAIEAAEYTFYVVDGRAFEYQTNAGWTSQVPRTSSQYNPLAPGFSPEYFPGSAIRIAASANPILVTIQDDDDTFLRVGQDGNQMIKMYGTTRYNTQVENAGHTHILLCNGDQGRIHALKSSERDFSHVSRATSVFFFSGLDSFPEPGCAFTKAAFGGVGFTNHFEILYSRIAGPTLLFPEPILS